MRTFELMARPLHGSIEELVAGCSSREPMVPADSKSGARFEWVIRDGERFVLKYQDARDDWLMRATGDLDGHRYAALWSCGLLDEVPTCIDHCVVGAAVENGVGAILLKDVTDTLLPLGDEPFDATAHARFLDHMAQLHAHFWGWSDTIELTTLTQRYLTFSPAVARAEEQRGSDALVPKVMAEGWGRLPTESPAAAEILMPLLDDPEPLVTRLASVPQTFVHGDWKAGNLGVHSDGRTVLLDWGEEPGQASPIADLAWYLALNSARLPESKERSVARYREALHSHGVDTDGWWDRAFGLEMVGAMVQFGWEKAFGGAGPELGWWEAEVVKGAAYL